MRLEGVGNLETEEMRLEERARDEVVGAGRQEGWEGSR